ncbi:flagellar filament capping protein FliD [Metabacillus fastidiosus]|uniref:flagellar filament capping protein FliD n=1 Tax=Metabacillus fastidiosus TaxID=1458 RepID=UPI002DC04210|nr:flagellar filament capping protein FliD [Metabacillus fastidiosus]MEC2077297.1 flagellar filament capping protein FliD [Metabacillus fastidiosus]
MVQRVGGLASGMDIDSIVSDMMKARRIPLDKLKQKKQILEWQRDGYREMNSLMLAFRNLTFDMKLSDKYRARTVASSNEDKVIATAKSSASLSSYNISQIEKLATASTKINAGKISDTTNNKKIDPSKSLFESRNDFVKSSGFGWKTGSVETQTLSVAEERKDFELVLKEGVKLKNNAADPSVSLDVSVKVDGKFYEVVTDLDHLTAGKVLVDEEGKLKFFDNIKKGSNIMVDYAATNRVETFKSSSDPTKPLKEIQLSRGSISYGDSAESFDDEDKIEIMINGDTYVNGTGSNSKNFYKDRQSQTGTPFATINETGKITFSTLVGTDTEVKVSYKQNYFAFDLSTHTSTGPINERFLVQGSESLNNVFNAISSSKAGVSAFYDSHTDQVTLTRKETGDHNNGGSQIITSDGFLNQVLRFEDDLGEAVEEKIGVNAKFTINGLETQRTSNTFEMNGVTFTLKDTFNLEGNQAVPGISINLSNDTSKVFDNIKAFVEKYNEMIDKIQGKISEERYRSYTPLTDTQLEQLSDKQQEQWEEKAKSGLLRRDTLLMGALTKVRQDFYGAVNSNEIDPKLRQLASIGITTTSNYLDGGKLQINENALKKAIEENPDSVEKLFNSNGTTYSEKGIINRLYDSLKESMDKLKERAGNVGSTNEEFSIGKNLKSLNSQISNFEKRMIQVEDRYWRQFTAMEKAIQRSNQQSTYLMQQFSF